MYSVYLINRYYITILLNPNFHLTFSFSGNNLLLEEENYYETEINPGKMLICLFHIF